MRIETKFPPRIIANNSNTKVSIYMETSNTSPLNKNNRLQFKNLMNEAVAQIQDSKVKDKIQEDLTQLYNNEGFWIHVKSGLAILMDESDMIVYLLNRKFSNRVSVGTHFNLNPLLRHFQSDDEYYILGLSKDVFSVYKGNRYQIENIQFDDNVDITLEEVLGTQLDGRILNVGSYGGVGSGNYHGHNTRSEEEKIDQQRYYQYIDKFIMQQFDDLDKHPIILLGLEENLGAFRKLTSNPHILDKGVHISLESINSNQKDLHQEVWPVIEQELLLRTERLMRSFNQRKELEVGSSDVSEVFIALKERRVDTLVLEDEKMMPNTDSFLKDYSTEVDVLSVLLDLAFTSKSKIIILPKEKMPSDSGVFALYRF